MKVSTNDQVQKRITKLKQRQKYTKSSLDKYVLNVRIYELNYVLKIDKKI